jgi:hypothetical protein
MSDVTCMYPSGFVGPASVPMTQGRTPDQVARALMSRQISIRTNDIPGSEQVAALADYIGAGGLPSNHFELGERVLKLAIEMFSRTSGESGWLGWIELQHKQGKLGPMHRQWLDETIRLLYEGKPRAVQGVTWCKLLGPNTTAKLEHPISPQVLRVIQQSEPAQSVLSQWLLKWVQAPGGVHDLAQSLNVIYGPR